MYLQKYHKYQKKFKHIEQDGEFQKQSLQNIINEKTGINSVIREQLDLKEQQRIKLEQELNSIQGLITDNEEKYIKLKKSNAVYLDHFARDKINDRLSADIRQQELNNRAENDNGVKIIAQIKFYLAKHQLMNDRMTKSGHFRKQLLILLEKTMRIKNLSHN